ncbi:MAG: LPS export ABC transporter periplasmic protein LptC [Gammaproteobacteria bacterium]|nr:LPS export ABC transporter periplasmic protein LptC [Gammaproteobacteria bacterium]
MTVETNYSSQLQNSPEQQHYTHKFKGFALTNTNDSGNAQSIIQAPSTQLLVGEQKTLMDSPTITMYRDQQAPIVITAVSAEILHQQNMTILIDDVKVSMPDQRNNNIVLTTEQLSLDNVTQSAKTTLPATIIHGKGNMHGTGFEFNPHTQTMKFLKDVRGIYER